MKKNYYVNLKVLIPLFCMSIMTTMGLWAQTEFITTWKTDNPGASNSTSITIPTVGTANYDVDWNNDGTFDEFGLTGPVTHDFGAAGTYTIRVQGTFNIRFNNGGDRLKILDVNQWGNIVWSSFYRAFLGCENLDVTASDAPDLSVCTNTQEMFSRCFSLVGTTAFNSWDVSNITIMSFMFDRASVFNQDLGNWTPTSVNQFGGMFSAASAFQGIGLENWNNHFTASNINMGAMFQNADAFNADITGWVTTNVTNMGRMFYLNDLFNRDIGNWDVSNVTSLVEMFRNATTFNADLGNWTPTSCTNFSYMFLSATTFQGLGLNNWNNHFLASDIDMRGMFWGANAFNGDITGWVTTNVTGMSEMFRNNDSFDQGIGNWDVSNVTSMSDMFNGAAAFDQNLGNWTPTSCTSFSYMFNSAMAFQGLGLNNWSNHFTASNINMRGMFRNADAFNADITGWVTTNVINMFEMFEANNIFNQEIGNWDVSNVIAMQEMFNGAVAFDADLGNWMPTSCTNFTYLFNSAAAFQGTNLDQWSNRFTASDINMSGMFRNADAFNWDISTWVTTNVTRMAEMFESNNAIDQNLGNWDVSNVISMVEMFNGATAFDQDLGNWMPTSCGNFRYMFNSATAFQGTNLDLWSNRFTASDINMSGMFRNADAFNWDISTWVTTNVTRMAEMFELNDAVDQNFGSWDMNNVINGNEMFNSSGMSMTNWDNTLIGWHAQNFTNSNVTIGASGLLFCDATVQRDAMQDDGIFTFDGDFLNCVPGGVLAGNLMWYQADKGAFEDGVTMDPAENGDPVVSWFDSGNMVLEATQVGTAPTYVENFLNFNPGINFSGSPVSPVASTLSAGIDTDHHVVAVYIGVDQNASLFSTGNDDTTSNQALFYGLNSGNQIKQDFTGNGLSTAVTPNTPTIVNFDYNYALVSGPDPDLGSRTISINGSDVMTDNLVEPNILDLNTANSRIGGSFAGSGEDFSGTLAELIVYPTRQTNTNRRRIQTYLAIKYGITLNPDNDGSGSVTGTEGDYLASDGTTIWDHNINATYHNDVTGIGRDDVASLHQKQSLSSSTGAFVTMGNVGISATNLLNPNDFTTDLSYMLWGNDAGSTAVSEDITGDTCLKRMGRIWTVAETGTVGMVTLRIPQSALPNYTPTLLVSADETFDNTDTYIALTDDGSGNYQAMVDFTDGQYFSFAEHNGAPVAICKDLTVQLDATGNASIIGADVDDGSSSCLGTPTFSLDKSTFDCSDIGPNTVTLTVTDPVSGMTSMCTPTVTVEDNVAPTALCQDINVMLDAMGNASITGADVDNGSNDACGIASLTVSPNTFDIFDVGPNTVTLTVTDVNGNTTDCMATVTVDNTLGIDDISMDLSTITMSPNPASEQILLSNPQGLELNDMTIYDLTGRRIHSVSLNSVGLEKTIDITQLASATYIMVVTSDTGRVTKQLVKK